MVEKLIHIAHKNFLTVRNNENKRPELKVSEEKREKHGGIRDAASQTVETKNTNGTQCSTVTL
jgi:hypothetical protein